MKNAVFALISISLLAGFAFSQAENSPDSQGILQLPDHFSMEVINSDGTKFLIQPENGRAELAYGDYAVRYWACEKTDADGRKWQLRGYPSKAITFTIGDQPASLDISPEPIGATVEVYGGDDYGFRLELRGPLDERYYLYCDGKQAEAPKLEIANAAKTFNVTLASKYG